jgi:N-carbamoyl-L-amino-acid hydrolase
VPGGGIFDGPLGVYAALEAVRAVQEADRSLSRPLEVVSFSEEEGARFSIGLLGSAVATGQYDETDALALTDDDGVTLRDRLDEIGFRGDDDIDPGGWHAWLELHVEQDTTLERDGVPVGVVESISGITNCRATVEGEANHAGATPMAERTDALAAASEFVLDVERAAREQATAVSSAVGTVSTVDNHPNARNIVPGTVEMDSDIRSTDYAAMNEIVGAARESLARLEAERGVETSIERYRDQEPSAMSDSCVAAALDAADAADVGARRMHSAALHDTANVAAVTQTAMLFAPSRDGISHTPQEWTDWADCARATAVLAGAMARLAE